MDNIQLVQDTGIEVWGYYQETFKEYCFTCINQDANTPQHLFQLDYRLPFAKGIAKIRSMSIDRVYVPIVKK